MDSSNLTDEQNRDLARTNDALAQQYEIDLTTLPECPEKPTYELRRAKTLGDLKAMLDRVQPHNLTLPLRFVVLIGRTPFPYEVEHVGRTAIAEDVVEGDKGAFVRPTAAAPTHTLMMFTVLGDGAAALAVADADYALVAPESGQKQGA